jgi:hypothetical protein
MAVLFTYFTYMTLALAGTPAFDEARSITGALVEAVRRFTGILTRFCLSQTTTLYTPSGRMAATHT